MANKEFSILVRINGGIIESVHGLPLNCRLYVVDYDTDGFTEDELEFDERGKFHHPATVWTLEDEAIAEHNSRGFIYYPAKRHAPLHILTSPQTKPADTEDVNELPLQEITPNDPEDWDALMHARKTVEARNRESYDGQPELNIVDICVDNINEPGEKLTAKTIDLHAIAGPVYSRWFRMFDDDDNMYLGGIFHDNDWCEGQDDLLAWGMADYGCTYLEVSTDGETWNIEVG